MRLLISTGEVSGDLQGALLTQALLAVAADLDIELEIIALGGDRMAAAGANVLYNTASIGAVGLLESLPYVLPTQRIQDRVRRDLQAHPPDLVVLIDYLGPNVSLGTWLRRTFPELPVFYYIAPQEWVWSLGKGKTTQIINFVDQILAVFPQEAKYYAQRGANVTWVGHPLLDTLPDLPSRAQARAHLGIPEDQTAIALLPASRQQEIKYLLPVMFEAAQVLQTQDPSLHFWIPLSLPTYKAQIQQAIHAYSLRATLLEGQSQTVIAAADLAITKSGTVNLELALQNIPQVVIYRVSRVTAWIAQHLLNFSIPFMSPPNLVLMEAIVPELLQAEASPERIVAETQRLLRPEIRQQVFASYDRMRVALGEPGVCHRTAELILRSRR
ncbi:MAG: lipid-A-disaccharide synthase [Cyanobacteria bacterium P01_H01_bin.121]